jgi:hypothetical protein
VEFNDVTDRTLFASALREEGYEVSELATQLRFVGATFEGTFANGKLTVTGNRTFDIADQNALKRAYSRQVVAASARRFGWQVKKTEDTKLTLQRRY